jgi:hypothetical protein
VSDELAGAVSQIQKTVFDFVKNQPIKDQLKNESGDDAGSEVYKVNPKSYLIVGKLSQLIENDDKFTCFQLFRGALQAPEILTYDELFERAKCIVETISHKDRCTSREIGYTIFR